MTRTHIQPGAVYQVRDDRDSHQSAALVHVADDIDSHPGRSSSPDER